MKEPTHICGPADDAIGPSAAHYNWHRYHRTPACGKALRENAWREAEHQAGHPIADYRSSRNMEGHECGPREAAEGPSGKHYDWHRYHQTPQCGKAKVERNWLEAEQSAGHPLPDYEPVRNMDGYECGTADEAVGPSTGHYHWHRRNGEDPCGKAIREHSWKGAERAAERPLPDYEPNTMYDPDAETFVYQITFIDGDRYYGVTSRNPEVRWREHRGTDTPLGRKLRSGTMFMTEVLCVAPNRRLALEVERMAIKSGNPWGSILNDFHNEREGIANGK